MMHLEFDLADLIRIAENGSTDSAVLSIWRAFQPHLSNDSILHTMSGMADPHNLADIYDARLGHHRNLGTVIGGFEESIRALNQESGRVTGVSIDSSDYHALAFVNQSRDRLIGFLYVKKDGMST